MYLKKFLDILKNNFWPVSASTPRSQSGFPNLNCQHQKLKPKWISELKLPTPKVKKQLPTPVPEK
jgi:hypothetical protein